MKLSHVLSMLLAAMFTAGAMTVGQSFAEVPKGNCVTTFDYSKMTPEQVKEVFPL